MDPIQLLREAIKAVPALKYGLGIAGVIAVLAIAMRLAPDARIAVFGSMIVLLLMVVLVIFAKGVMSSSKILHAHAAVLTWSALLILLLSTSLLVGSVFFGKPLNLRHLLETDSKPVRNCLKGMDLIDDGGVLVRQYADALQKIKNRLFYSWAGGIAATNSGLPSSARVTDIFTKGNELHIRHDWQDGLLILSPVEEGYSAPVTFFQGTWKQANGTGCIEMTLPILPLFERRVKDDGQVGRGAWYNGDQSADSWSSTFELK